MMTDTEKHTDNIVFRKPTNDDGLNIHQLVAMTPTMDLNSLYSYYLICKHFTDTCVVAEHNGEIVGFLSAYFNPKKHNSLFIWQIVVRPGFRGHGIGSLLLRELLSRYNSEILSCVEATVHPENLASRSLFEKLAKQHDTEMHESTFLDASAFGDDQDHGSEILLHIPLNRQHSHQGGE